MLTPSDKDPNRKKELTRCKDDPAAFGGAYMNERPRDWKPTKLKSISVKTESEESKKPTK